MNGAYILIMRLESSKSFIVGSLGKIKFDKGFYCYIGSAIGSKTIENRCERHLKKNKKMRWHIDYLRKEAEIISIFAIPSKEKIECEVVNKIFNKADSFISRFGSSDCNCKSHLFYFKDKKSLYKLYPIFSKGIQIYYKV
jgi:sugar fermentation stimulation protein A